MKVGSKLSAQDNGTHMFVDYKTIPHCPQCGYRLDYFAINRGYRWKDSQEDVGATYDGYLIVSEQFRSFCLHEGYTGLKFEIFENDHQHYALIVEHTVAFDYAKRKTKFEKLCPACENYESVVGAKPSYLITDQALSDGMYRSDLLIGSGNEKHPLIFVAETTRLRMLASGLKGLEFSDVFGLEG